MSDQPEALRLAAYLSLPSIGLHASATELRRQHSEIEALKAENFALAAGQCVNVTNDEGGRAYCAEIDRLKAERDALKNLYNELLFAVGNKHPNETRHQTALRYITQAETTTDAMLKAREVQP